MRRLSILAAVLGLVGCPADDVNTFGGNVEPDTTQVLDATAEPDLPPPPDAPTTPDGDQVVPDPGPSLDVPPLSCDETPLPALCACDAHDECAHPFCVPSSASDTGFVCAPECSGGCPDGWSCQQILVDGETEVLCVDRFVQLCRPCNANSDCSTTGFEGQHACRSYGDEGSFCGAVCGQQSACPQGFTCDAGQCVSQTGQCTCSPQAVGDQASTECVVANTHGSCAGERVCTDDGLSDCDAAQPALEECNGLDDDCNGVVDDVITAACEIKNVFGTCDGTRVCVGGVGSCKGQEAAQEICDGLDNDCNQVVDDGFPDLDDDGLAGCVDPDDDGDGVLDELDICPNHADPTQADTDGDGQGDACDPDDDNDGTADGQDCKPLIKQVHPGATEACDGIDNDCDGATDEAACVDDNPCTDAVCDPVSGCLFKFNQAPCNDANACTAGDVCIAGGCGGVAIGCDDSNPCTADTCSPMLGCTHGPTTHVCSDGDACTAGDVCGGGVCVGGVAVECPDGGVCQTAQCHPTLGCQITALTGPCDDGSQCTGDDTCGPGGCLGADLDCDDGEDCTVDTCEDPDGCVHEAQTGEACDDGSPCTGPDICTEDGECAGLALGCQCILDADCAGFENATVCDGTLVCVGFSCVVDPATVVVCGAPAGSDAACGTASCDAATGECGWSAAPVGTACNDGNLCTSDDACAAGTCSGEAVDCADASPCTLDLCEVDVGCLHPADPAQAACDDGEACTQGDACAAGVCEPGAAMDCDDGDACNGLETCALVGCDSGDSMVCEDADDCTIDSCELSQCVFAVIDGCGAPAVPTAAHVHFRSIGARLTGSGTQATVSATPTAGGAVGTSILGGMPWLLPLP